MRRAIESSRHRTLYGLTELLDVPVPRHIGGEAELRAGDDAGGSFVDSKADDSGTSVANAEERAGVAAVGHPHVEQQNIATRLAILPEYGGAVLEQRGDVQLRIEGKQNCQ